MNFTYNISKVWTAMAVVVLSLGFVSNTEAKRWTLSSLKKEKGSLVKYKKKCDKISDVVKKDKCLTKYNKRKIEYKRAVADFKSNVAKAGNKKVDSKKSKANRQKSINLYLDFYNESCLGATSKNCAAALYNLGNLHYAAEEDEFRATQQAFEKAMDRWEDNDKKGAEPLAPNRTHKQSLRWFKELEMKYPNWGEMAKVYYRLGFIYSIQGDDEKSYEMLTKLVTRFPKHPQLTVPAQLRIGEYWFLKRKYRKAIKAYEKVPLSHSGPEAGFALYHRAECYYNMAEFATAAKYYYEYVVRADNGDLNEDLRDEALEFMAACWADLENGVKTAQKFLKGRGHSWEKDVFFVMGEKNKSHDRLEEATKAYKHLLKVAPEYPKAPMADISIVNMLVIQKKPKEAQKARISLAERYRPGSRWHQMNSSNKKTMDEANAAVKKARFEIPLYYHIMGTKNKKKVDQKMLSKASQGYQDYLNIYPDDTWEVYEVHQNLGAIGHLLKDYKSAAKQFRWLGKAPIEKYGKMPSDKKKTLLSRADASYNYVYMLDLDREKNLASLNSDTLAAYNSNETQAYMIAVEEYMQDFGGSNTAPDIAYNSAVVHYGAKKYAKAIVALDDLNQRFPNHKHTKLIKRMLGQSLLENGDYARAEEVFTGLLAKLKPSSKDYAAVKLSVASAIFKQADKLANSGQGLEAAQAYLRLVERHPKVKIADKALYEAGIQYEKMQDITSSTTTLMRVHREYPKSDLNISSILKAASIYRKAEQYRAAAQTFLVVKEKFSKDSSGFLSIGWAAESYEKVPDLALAAQTYELSHRDFPKHPKTPSFLYNAGQTYEDLKDFGNAVRVYDEIGKSYPKSSYAIEAVFSVPIIQEAQGNYEGAVASYVKFITSYKDDPKKVIRAQLGAGKIYDDKLNDNKSALALFKDVKKTFVNNPKGGLLSAIPAEASFRSGEMFYDKITPVVLDGSPKINAKRVKSMTANLEIAIENYSFSIEQAEQKWTLRSTNRMGDLFMAFASVTGNEVVNVKNPYQKLADEINIKKGLPNFYGKARGLYQKNLDLAKEQKIVSEWIDSSANMYMETYFLEGMVFEDIGSIIANSPIPPGLTPEEEEEYRASLEDKKFEFLTVAEEKYGVGLKAAQFYAIENESKQKITDRLRELNPESENLDLKPLTAAQMEIVFVDDLYKKNMEQINSIYGSAASEKKKLKDLAKIRIAAEAEIKRLTAELKKLSGSGDENETAGTLN